jgi:hypothetical protein
MIGHFRCSQYSGIGIVAILVCVVFCDHLLAQHDPDKDEEAQREKRLKSMKSFAEEYKIFAADDKKRQFKFHEDALIRFNNPAARMKDGAAYLWSDQGRQQAMLRFWSFDGKRFDHSLLSLSERPLFAERDGNVKWNPTEPGITFRELSDAPKPSDSAPARLQQMRALANRFSAVMNHVSHDPKPVELRLLSQPLFRYKTNNEREYLDGALFTFAEGTAPQMHLLFEARPIGDSYKWYYALVRFTYWPLTAKYDDKEVFSAEELPYKVDPKRTFQWLPPQRIVKD